MTRLDEVSQRSPAQVRGLHQYPNEDVRLLYASGYWDGPLEGLAEVGGERVWYCFAEESDDEKTDGWFRRYWLVRLSAQQLEEEDARHASFRAHVGTHFDYDAARKRRPEERKPKEQWHLHYDRFPSKEAQPPELDESIVLGWFEW